MVDSGDVRDSGGAGSPAERPSLLEVAAPSDQAKSLEIKYSANRQEFADRLSSIDKVRPAHLVISDLPKGMSIMRWMDDKGMYFYVCQNQTGPDGNPVAKKVDGLPHVYVRRSLQDIEINGQKRTTGELFQGVPAVYAKWREKEDAKHPVAFGNGSDIQAALNEPRRAYLKIVNMPRDQEVKFGQDKNGFYFNFSGNPNQHYYLPASLKKLEIVGGKLNNNTIYDADTMRGLAIHNALVEAGVTEAERQSGKPNQSDVLQYAQRMAGLGSDSLEVLEKNARAAMQHSPDNPMFYGYLSQLLMGRAVLGARIEGNRIDFNSPESRQYLQQAEQATTQAERLLYQRPEAPTMVNPNVDHNVGMPNPALYMNNRRDYFYDRMLFQLQMANGLIKTLGNNGGFELP